MMRLIQIAGLCLLLQVTLAGQSPAQQSPSWDRTSFGLVPLTDLGTNTYQGFPGGLYPDGRNAIPEDHLDEGVKIARGIVPLNSEGLPDDRTGKIVLLSVGFSNTTMEFRAFKPLADADQQKRPDLVVVDGAQGGRSASMIADPNAAYWQVTDERLNAAGINGNQVEVVWLKQVIPQPRLPFPGEAKKLQGYLKEIVQNMTLRYPNLQLVYISSRIYGGYANRGNPEPHAYESGFSVKWLIEEQLNGDPSLNYDPAKGAVNAPWLAWGPYIWADGTTPRSDDVTWIPEEYNPDGLHPNARGQRKVAEMLLDYFKTHPTAQPWFTK